VSSAVPTPLVSFCVVGTNGAEVLRACLDAIELEQRLLERPTEVLVLDNASTDDSVRVAREHPVGARVIALTRREGKAANDSRLLDEAQGRYALLLNEDSELRAGATKELVDALGRDPQAACAGAALLRPDGRQQPSAWRFPGFGTTVAQALLLHKSLVVQSGGTGRGTRKVDWCQSACLLVRVQASATIGHLDPEYFVYGDEVDLQRRLRDNGWHTLFVPTAQCVHHEGLSTGDGARRRIIELHRNQDRYLRTHHGRFVAWCCRPVAAIPYVLRTVAATVLPGHSARRYWWHVQAILAPKRGEGIREAAEAFNAQLDDGGAQAAGAA
jgi:N-acetylglucosaminyl-diphospho-decaprenol L-rhamnosyltransferase